MPFDFKHFFLIHILIPILYQVIRIYFWTFRIQIDNEQQWQDLLDQGERVILCGWHQQLFSVIRIYSRYRKYKPAVIASKSKDGDIAEAVLKHSGWKAIRGSSSSGGSKALLEIIRKIQQVKLVGHILDGPRGPIGRVKPGIVPLAVSCNAYIVPTFCSADRAWFLKSWDKHFIPKPFARLHIRYLDPILLDKKEKNIDNHVGQLEEIIRPGLIQG